MVPGCLARSLYRNLTCGVEMGFQFNSSERTHPSTPLPPCCGHDAPLVTSVPCMTLRGVRDPVPKPASDRVRSVHLSSESYSFWSNFASFSSSGGIQPTCDDSSCNNWPPLKTRSALDDDGQWKRHAELSSLVTKLPFWEIFGLNLVTVAQSCPTIRMQNVGGPCALDMVSSSTNFIEPGLWVLSISWKAGLSPSIVERLNLPRCAFIYRFFKKYTQLNNRD